MIHILSVSVSYQILNKAIICFTHRFLEPTLVHMGQTDSAVSYHEPTLESEWDTWAQLLPSQSVWLPMALQ